MVPSFALVSLPHSLRSGALPDDLPTGTGDFAAILAQMMQEPSLATVTCGAAPAPGPSADGTTTRAEDIAAILVGTTPGLPVPTVAPGATPASAVDLAGPLAADVGAILADASRPRPVAVDRTVETWSTTAGDGLGQPSDQTAAPPFGAILPPTVAGGAPPASPVTRTEPTPGWAQGGQVESSHWPAAAHGPTATLVPTAIALPPGFSHGREARTKTDTTVGQPATLPFEAAPLDRPGPKAPSHAPAVASVPEAWQGRRALAPTAPLDPATVSSPPDGAQVDLQPAPLSALTRAHAAVAPKGQTPTREVAPQGMVPLGDVAIVPAKTMAAGASTFGLSVAQPPSPPPGFDGPGADMADSPRTQVGTPSPWRIQPWAPLPTAHPTQDQNAALSPKAIEDRDASTGEAQRPEGTILPAGQAAIPTALPASLATPAKAAMDRTRPPIALPEGTRAILRQITPPTADHEGAVEIALFPKDLGQVRLDIQPGSTGTHITVSTDRPETLDLIRRHSAELIAEFRGAGMSNPVISFAVADGQTVPRPDPAGALVGGSFGAASQQAGQHSGGSSGRQPSPPQDPSLAERADPAPAVYRSDPARQGGMILRL